MLWPGEYRPGEHVDVRRLSTSQLLADFDATHQALKSADVDERMTAGLKHLSGEIARRGLVPTHIKKYQNDELLFEIMCYRNSHNGYATILHIEALNRRLIRK